MNQVSQASQVNEKPAILATTAADWRTWLAANSQSETETWLVIYHKDCGIPSIGYAEAIEHALCYGWIDSHARKRDASSFMLRFSPRRPRSNWSKVNVARAVRMTTQGLMTPPGQAAIDQAKSAGRWPGESTEDPYC